MTEQTPAEATAKLDQLKADPAWRDGFLSGGAPQGREYAELSELAAQGDKVAAAMAGIEFPGPFQDSDHLQMMNTAELLRSMGFPPTAIRETLSGKEATQADVDLANAWKAQNLKSKEFVTRLMSGEPDAARQLMVANIILNSPRKAS